MACFYLLADRGPLGSAMQPLLLIGENEVLLCAISNFSLENRAELLLLLKAC